MTAPYPEGAAVRSLVGLGAFALSMAVSSPPATAASSLSVTPSGRVTSPPVSELSPDMQAAYEDSVRNFGGALGPRLPLLRSPEVVQAWDALSRSVLKSDIPRPLKELTIITVGAFWKSDFEWYIHAKEAKRVGISEGAIEAIRLGQRPRFHTDGEKIVYNYVSELQRERRITDQTYDAARRFLGDKALVELTVLIGHYTLVSMTLNAHKVPLPDGVSSPFAP